MWVISIGFVVVLVITIPLGYYNLDDNIKVQVGAAVLLFIVSTLLYRSPACLSISLRGRSRKLVFQRCPVQGTRWLGRWLCSAG